VEKILAEETKISEVMMAVTTLVDKHKADKHKADKTKPFKKKYN
jgi:hypothetical protein